MKDLERTKLNNKPFLFEQDGALALTAKSTQEWLRTEIPSYISKLEWPPSSPDLNPLDFSLWSVLESRACSNSHRNLEGLRKTLCREWDLIPQEIMRTAAEAVPRRKGSNIKGEDILNELCSAEFR